MKFRTCREAAEELNEEFGVNQSHLKRGCMEGKYPSMKIGNRLLVDVDALRPILERERQDQQGLLSTTELAQRTGLSESAIRRAVTEGWLPCRIVGRNMRFDLMDVQRAIGERMGSKYDT